MQHEQQSLNRVAFSATVQCLSGCAAGEVLGIGNALDLPAGVTLTLVRPL